MSKYVLLVFHPQLDFTAFGTMQYELPNHFFDDIAASIDNADEAIAILDAHDGSHLSFAGNHPWRYPGQKLVLNEEELVLFPIHGVQNTFGATIVRELKEIDWNLQIKKNQYPDATGLDAGLKQQLDIFLELNSGHTMTFGLCGIEHEGIIHSTKDWLTAKGEQVELLPTIFYPEITVVFPPSLSEE